MHETSVQDILFERKVLSEKKIHKQYKKQQDQLSKSDNNAGTKVS